MLAPRPSTSPEMCPTTRFAIGATSFWYLVTSFDTAGSLATSRVTMTLRPVADSALVRRMSRVRAS